MPTNLRHYLGDTAVSDIIPLVCPVCKLNDQIQKVTAIVTAQPDSNLGKLLAMPDKHDIPAPVPPQKSVPPILPTTISPTYSKPSPRFGCFTILFIVGGMSGLYLLCGIPSIFMQIIGSYGQAAITDTQNNWTVFGALILTVGSIFLGVALQRRAVAKAETLNRAANAAEDARAAEQNERGRREYEAEVERWQKTDMERYQTEMERYQAEWLQWRTDFDKASASHKKIMDNWDIAYYCHRDDRVFLPNSSASEVVPPHLMIVLLSGM